MNDDVREIHARAVVEGRNGYTDPVTGYRVFTELAHLRRGTCCGSACRHCPFGHLEVRRTAGRADGPWWELAGPCEADRLEIVSWSGGKDAFLALRSLGPRGRVVLLTTFDPATGLVPIQGVSLDGIRRQARRLGHDLLAVPVRGDGDYLFELRRALEVAARRAPIERLVFGDLHLREVRAWREDALSDLPLAFPLWGAGYDRLLDELERSRAEVRISACEAGVVPVGARFDRRLVASLPPEVDAFGENGEFHTYVELGSST